MKFKVLIPSILFLVFGSCKKEHTKEIDLSGEWRFQIDSLDQGMTEKWYTSKLLESVQLPGSMTGNGKGY
ncbi:MAG: hypothetical protein R3294_11715, partial [Arenibacter troitsensis]|nr:hypothetical protein [Arenibacter troitsensis]